MHFTKEIIDDQLRLSCQIRVDGGCDNSSNFDCEKVLVEDPSPEGQKNNWVYNKFVDISKNNKYFFTY